MRPGTLVSKNISLAVLILSLSACQASKNPDPQDNFQVRPSEAARIFPEETVAPQYTPPKEGDFPNSPAAYHATPMASYADHPLNDNLDGALEAADYNAALKASGWLKQIKSDGPYTVFAIPNVPMERYAAQWPGGMLAPANHPRLSRFIGRTIVVGYWDEARLRRALAAGKKPLTLKTLSGDRLIVALSSDGSLLLQGADGTARVKGAGFPQSNGMLYFTDSALPS